MKNSLKTKVLSILALFFVGLIGLMAQDVTTVEAMSNDISNNLDLEAVASIFGDAKDLEDFESQWLSRSSRSSRFSRSARSSRSSKYIK